MRIRFFEEYRWCSSPLEVANVSVEKAATSYDWVRYANKSSQTVFINGKSLQEVAGSYNNFLDENRQADPDMVKSFFEEEILQEMIKKHELEAQTKEDLFSALFRILHQGGVFVLASAALAEAIKEDTVLDGSAIARRVDIIPTEQGFKIQEYAEVAGLMINGQHQKADNGDYFIRVRATVNVDLTDARTPRLTIEDNAIDYKHDALKSKLHHLDWKQCIIDFLKNLFGCSLGKQETVTLSIEDSVKTEDVSSDSSDFALV